MAPWTRRIEQVAYPLGDGFRDVSSFGIQLNILHSWVGHSIFFYKREVATVPNLYQIIYDIDEGRQGLHARLVPYCNRKK